MFVKLIDSGSLGYEYWLDYHLLDQVFRQSNPPEYKGDVNR